MGTTPNLSLKGKVALVTGASGGLGSHFGKVLAEAGATVVLAARRVDKLEEEVAALTEAGYSAYAVELDVTDSESIANAFDEAQRRAGLPEVIVNNAGITTTTAALDLSLEQWCRIVDTNLTGCFLVAREAASRLKAAAKGGAVVNIASILGLRQAGMVAPYSASKAALIQLTKSLALEWARHGIRVNALAPGYIETDINRDFFASEAGQRLIKRIPQRRLGQPEHLDAPLLLLCSDSAAYMTGSVLAVDGGHLVSSL